jgi:hypothetical protein
MESSYRNILDGYDLRLMSWGDGTGVPTSGNSLVLAGTDSDNLVQVRVFDPNGDRIDAFETNDGKFLVRGMTGPYARAPLELNLDPVRAGALSALKKHLPVLLRSNVVIPAEAGLVLDHVTPLLGPALGVDSVCVEYTIERNYDWRLNQSLSRYIVERSNVPGVCIRCGEPATQVGEHALVRQELGSRRLGPSFYAPFTKETTFVVPIPTCSRHEKTWRKKDRPSSDRPATIGEAIVGCLVAPVALAVVVYLGAAFAFPDTVPFGTAVGPWVGLAMGVVVCVSLIVWWVRRMYEELRGGDDYRVPRDLEAQQAEADRSGEIYIPYRFQPLHPETDRYICLQNVSWRFAQAARPLQAKKGGYPRGDALTPEPAPGPGPEVTAEG